MVIVWRYALRLGVVLACVTGAALAQAGPAQAAFSTRLSGLPERFTAGGEVRTVSAVVSRTDGGCVKVRWSLVLTVRDIRLDQVKVDRVEEDGSFPLQIRTDGDVARLTDRQLDPGTLCPGRTVTARYRVAFAGDIDRGRVTLAAEAYDARLRLLSRQAATRTVVGAEATPSESAPAPTESVAEPTEPATAGGDEETAATEEPLAAEPAAGAGRPVSGSGGFGAVQAAFLLGGLLLSLGLGLLLRLRHLTRTSGGEDESVPGGRWPSPGGYRRREPVRW
ncbi:hypothetical protein AB0C04_14670 [Micromonospora sp. NPDC048909]|uniref:hypothetical protein n=1 Tax=Micromonospora sp. NPDC048909 TaxID=3155643 RepID=UPI0033DC2A29